MAARGTGLPGGPDAGMTPLVDLSGSAGMGERAAADGFARLRQSIDDGMKRFLQPQLDQRAQERAALDAEAGQFELRMVINPDDAQYNEGIKRAQLGNVRTEIEDAVDNALLANRYDPDGFSETMGQARTAMLERIPGWLAIDAGVYFNERVQNAGTTIRHARAEKDIQGANQDASARILRLEGRMMNADPNTVEYQMLRIERDDIQETRVANPTYSYTAEMRTNDDINLQGRVLVANASRLALVEAAGAGGGPPGQAAAYRLLDDSILNSDDPMVQALDPQVRIGLYDLARKQVDAYTRTDMEERRAEADRRRLEAQMQTEAREAWQLRVQLGEVTSRDEIEAADDIDDGQKAGLLSAFDGRQRQIRSDDRAATAAIMQPLSDRARAGDLTAGEIAGELEAGNIDGTQARTLRVYLNRALRPMVASVLSPFEDGARRQGQLRPINQLRAQAEAEAAAWVANNPDAPLADQLAAGQVISQRYLGAPTAAGAAGATDKNEARRRLNVERTARAATPNPMPPREFERRRSEIENGR